jgi:hypothetical protein
MTDQPTPQTEAGRRLLGFDLGPPETYWVNLSANEMRTAILAIEAQARTEGLDESRCWFCKRMVPVDALIAGYATFDEQRLACMACNEVMQARIEALDLDALAFDRETLMLHDYLTSAAELADLRATVIEDKDGMGEFYKFRATDWNRILAIARGSLSDAARKSIDAEYAAILAAKADR